MHGPDDSHLLLLLEGIFDNCLDVRNLRWRFESVIGHLKLDLTIPVTKGGHGWNVDKTQRLSFISVSMERISEYV
jgi:hypothetical protein